MCVHTYGSICTLKTTTTNNQSIKQTNKPTNQPTKQTKTPTTPPYRCFHEQHSRVLYLHYSGRRLGQPAVLSQEEYLHAGADLLNSSVSQRVARREASSALRTSGTTTACQWRQELLSVGTASCEIIVNTVRETTITDAFQLEGLITFHVQPTYCPPQTNRYRKQPSQYMHRLV